MVFSLIALVLFVSTPAGRALPEAVSGLVSTVDDAATPALTDQQPRTQSRLADPPGADDAGPVGCAGQDTGRVRPQGRAGRGTADGAACGGRCRSGLGVARPVSRSRALAALASPATACGRP